MGYQETFDKAKKVFQGANKGGNLCGDQTLLFGDNGERLRWFLLPCEAEEFLTNGFSKSSKEFQMPFFPTLLTDKGHYKNATNGRESTSVPHLCVCTPLNSGLLMDKSQLITNGNLDST